MGADTVLRESEQKALSGDQFISNVSGKTKIKSNKSIKSAGVMVFLTAIILVFAILFSSGNLIPSAISERLVEETDVQYADAVESKKIVFQQALYNGEIPEDTAKILKENGVLVGYSSDSDFIEGNKNDGGELVLKMGDKIILAQDFITEVSHNIELYNAFNNATYSRAAYYYDEAAKEVFKNIGTSRNNYTNESDYNEVMNSVLGSGSNIKVNNVSLEQTERKNEETGEIETYYDYIENGNATNSKSDQFIQDVGGKNLASSEVEATLYSADALKTADTISKEQRSSLFFALFMENISKMKAGEGNESKINEAMNFLYQDSESEIVDVKTGEVKKVKGTPLDSPSLYAVLADQKVDKELVNNYSSDRVLKTIENQLNVDNNSNIINNTVASSSSKITGSVGRLIQSGNSSSNLEVLNLVHPTISNSLSNNSYETIKGVNAGELLVEGAINVGKELAKASGGAAGDEAAVVAYSRLNSEVLAMDAAADRINRSPFDISSKNTFLGSIVYKFAINLRNNFKGRFSGLKTFAKTTSDSIAAIIPNTKADSADNYLANFGDCETYGNIGVVGSAQCAEIATFDPSTLNDPFNDEGFINFVNNNTTISASGTRTVNKNSDLSNYILFNDERKTPLGVMDGGIIESINNNSSSIRFISDIANMVRSFVGASDESKRIASGAEFVNSANNPDWQTYKYAQRYVSLARATSVLKQYAGNSTAYNNIKYFEGEENPVIAFISEYYKIANRDY